LVGIVGPNGAGKSTFIKTALGLVQPLAGRIEFFGLPLKKVRKRVAYVPQRETVDWNFPITVRDLVLMGRYGQLGLFRWPRQADKMSAERYLDMVGMAQYANRQISQLSGGQQQRVFIARALLQDADLFFLDEPFSGIDMATEKVVMELLHQLKQKGKTVFVVHHDLNTVERYFDWMILLNMRLVAAGPTSEVFHAESLYATFGKSCALFDEAFKLSHDRAKGL
ncbi:MAG: metal ABC transporter ATP-binding protein, partial [Parachlamydia sp.]|nr:metal ABC transporter ATP-binding protein [Parachlamydia sp.]